MILTASRWLRRLASPGLATPAFLAKPYVDERGPDGVTILAPHEQYTHADHPGVTITWEKRSLQAFADRPIDAMAQEYDLMVIDHPHVGEAARERAVLPPLDIHLDRAAGPRSV